MSKAELAMNELHSVTIKPIGDQGLLAIFGDTLELERNLAIIALERGLLDWPVEAVVSFNTIALHFDAAVISYDDVRNRLEREIGALRKEITPESRIVTIPVWYGDPWTRACVEEYCRTIHPIEQNPEFVVSRPSNSEPPQSQ